LVFVFRVWRKVEREIDLSDVGILKRRMAARSGTFWRREEKGRQEWKSTEEKDK
jgi:hypothetical protein